MGLFDFITGTKAPPSGIARQPKAALRAIMLGLNRDSAPFVVRDGSSEGVDLIAEWKIVDARWYEVFAKASLSKVFRILLKLDEAKGEVRALDQEWTVEWRGGMPSLSVSAEAFRGQKVEMSFGKAYAFTETLPYGQVYSYAFKTKEIKSPLQDIAAKSGWGWRGVAFGKL